MGHEPRVALLSYSNFWQPNEREIQAHSRCGGDPQWPRWSIHFEYDGEMSADVALNAELMARYPFCKLSGPANVLVMPALHSAHISANMLEELGVGTVVGPVLVGLEKPVQIVNMNSTVSDIINLAAIGCIDAIGQKNAQSEKVAEKTKAKRAKGEPTIKGSEGEVGLTRLRFLRRICRRRWCKTATIANADFLVG